MKYLSHTSKLLPLCLFFVTCLQSQNIELEGITGQSGVVINNPGLDGLVINNAVDDGIVVTADDIGLLITAGYQAGFFSTSGAHNEGAIYVANGNAGFPDIDFSGGILRSQSGFDLQLDRFNSGTEFKFQVSKQGNSLFSLEESGQAEFSDFLSIDPSGRSIEMGSNMPDSSAMLQFLETGSPTDRTGVIRLHHSKSGNTIIIDAAGSSNEPYIHMKRANGTLGIILDVDASGDSRITTDELEIKGGSDLAEHFDMGSGEKFSPGMAVSIDETKPGKLKVSNERYDKKVAGIISGANGIQSGLLMGQSGSIADGEYPVALIGRVYALADASNSPIVPGDLLTTSHIDGHLMKVKNHKKAKGAIVGKAMTGLNAGQGMILVLVNLQ